MEFNWIESSAFTLLGSILTLLVKWKMDDHNQRKQLKRDLKKDFMGYQIKTADNIIGLVYSNYNYVSTIINAINHLLEHSEDEEFDGDYIDELLERYIKQLDENEEKLMNSSIYLYYQFSDENWNFEDQRSLIDIMSKVNLLKADHEHYESIYDDSSPDEKQAIDNLQEEIEAQIIPELRSFVEILTKYQLSLGETLKLIKEKTQAQFNLLNE